MAEQTQIQIPQIKKFIEENIMEVRKMRKCVDGDFIDALIAVLLGDDVHYSYKVYNVNDWHILHVWIPGVGGDWALAVRFGEDGLEECWRLEAE